MRTTEHQAVQTGMEASDVLENEAFKLALKSLRDVVVMQWKALSLKDREGQLLCLQLARLADDFEGILRGFIENAKLARVDIDKYRNESPAKKLMRQIYG